MLIDIILIIILIVTFLLLITALVNLFIRVPYVPTPQRTIDRMIEVAALKKGEKVYDLGCGDGRFLFSAEKHTGVPGVGYEIAPMVFFLALLKKFMTRSESKIFIRNFFTQDIKDADVIFCYLMPHTLKKLAKKVKKECKKGTRIISHGFQIEGLTPEKKFKRDEKNKLPTLYLYRI